MWVVRLGLCEFCSLFSECSNSFGQGCSSPCMCVNGATCDHVTGVCSCMPGYQGSTCGQRKLVHWPAVWAIQARRTLNCIKKNCAEIAPIGY